MRRLCLLGLALAAACSDALEQTSSAGQVIAIVNSADNSVSFVSAKDLSVRTVDLQTPAGQGTTAAGRGKTVVVRSEEHTSELQSRQYLVCRLLLEKKKKKKKNNK